MSQATYLTTYLTTGCTQTAWAHQYVIDELLSVTHPVGTERCKHCGKTNTYRIHPSFLRDQSGQPSGLRAAPECKGDRPE